MSLTQTHLRGPRDNAKTNIKNIMRAVPLKRAEVLVPFSSVFARGAVGKLVGSISSSFPRSVLGARLPSTEFSRSSASRNRVF